MFEIEICLKTNIEYMGNYILNFNFPNPKSKVSDRFLFPSITICLPHTPCSPVAHISRICQMWMFVWEVVWVEGKCGFGHQTPLSHLFTAWPWTKVTWLSLRFHISNNIIIYLLELLSGLNEISFVLSWSVIDSKMLPVLFSSKLGNIY